MLPMTPRLLQLKALLTDDPNDAFLRYAAAMEYVSMGLDEEAVRQLQALIADQPYVPAYLQAGQILTRLGRDAEAADVLRRGIVEANRQGESHAAGEMTGFLAAVE